MFRDKKQSVQITDSHLCKVIVKREDKRSLKRDEGRGRGEVKPYRF